MIVTSYFDNFLWPLFVYISLPPSQFFFFKNGLIMATPLFQPSHIVGNLIYLLFFFFKKGKRKKNLQNLKLFFCCSYCGDLWVGWDGDGVCLMFFLFSTTFGFNIGKAKGALG